MNALLQQFLGFARRSPLMLASIVVFVGLGVGDYFLWQRQAALAARHERVRQDGEGVLQSLTGHSRVLNQVAAVQAALTRIDKNLIVETDLAENLGYFYAIETSSGARLSGLHQLSSQPANDDNPYRSIPFSLQVSGTYYQVMTFLRSLETGPRVLRVRSYSFSRHDPAVDNVAADLNVDLLGRP